MFQKHAVARIICRHIMRASVSARTIRTHNMSVQMYVRYACTYVRKSACHFRKGIEHFKKSWKKNGLLTLDPSYFNYVEITK